MATLTRLYATTAGRFGDEKPLFSGRLVSGEKQAVKLALEYEADYFFTSDSSGIVGVDRVYTQSEIERKIAHEKPKRLGDDFARAALLERLNQHRKTGRARMYFIKEKNGTPRVHSLRESEKVFDAKGRQVWPLPKAKARGL
jgi:hypothetical protein